MTRYLLAAEADKIQDLLFRSSRLREVVGGSQLLTRFCHEVPKELGIPDDNILISDGGSFRLLFDTEEQARRCGEELAEVYRRATGGTLTVAEPVPVNNEKFGTAVKQADENLRRAKRWRAEWEEPPHLPYMAFCSSCGVGLAVAYRAYYPDEEPQYLCLSCLNKGAERPSGEPGEFLERFYREVVGEEGLKQADWPGKAKRKGRTERDPLEDIADYDPRCYVAYLLADGNEMGKIFGACREPQQMRELSKGLSQAIRRALAEPIRMLMETNSLDDRPNFIPVLPLILGGDDVFVLIPAPWALDFARRFCEAYEREMQNLFEKIKLTDVPPPTVSATVVICKSKHPYRLAHEIGEWRLKEAKRIGKRLVLKGKQPRSTVNFEVVLGGRLLRQPPDSMVRPTLRPYWVGNDVPEGWGLPIQVLIEQRWEMRNVPNKRLAELRGLYDEPPESMRAADLVPWQARLNRLQARIGRKEEHRKVVEGALKTLGDEGGKAYWYQVDRYPEDIWYGHGLPDLLEAWDFALALDKDRREYEEAAE